ncbi:Myo-inositol 2-dehydrogenase [Rubrobacter xylanophilus DSM 9941]|uniref:Inositol 2-dehydrogenase n=1 Tax=Rubrobacter xylanophilus (strain DSM 9941 / JCM 11954 / NBRC 16129 / PRD-1) TaxID=266117 RepID=IOLG_RUBXD|nr:Gfo/Idh/MocA family oxidoreductase [Rubrobacter xylanophilus]Q1AV95.1 RecName: Full=Inositol 2-dehydrogenase; AltName: Full=Myo-inositol 2-dehydrogenase; Short=MI 2-dehydrogenase [Rubrobacter xylanophilus DSM 9941]ABG04683.1 Myo-inositol 2-dehydrogenase [Rubrobacter xylanophilus DSM 9941]
MRGDSERIAVGVVGTGGMGGMHAENLHFRVPGARLVAVADLDTRRAGGVAERSGAEVFEDGFDLIRSDRVEAVVIASPDPTHAPLVLECLKNEKPVLCEKPLADSADAARKVVEAEVELGRKLVQVGFMRRYDPQHVAVKEAVASGAVGAPVLFRGWHRNADIEPGITSEWVVINATIHDIDSARWFIEEEIEEVYVRGMNTAPKLGANVWDLQLIQFTTAGGRLGSIETNVVSGYGYEVGVEIVGERGTVQVPPLSGAIVRRGFAASQRIEDGWLARFHAAYVIEMQGWVGALLRGEAPAGPDAWDGYASLVVADACIASLRSGAPQKVETLEPPTLYRRDVEVTG